MTTVVDEKNTSLVSASGQEAKHDPKTGTAASVLSGRIEPTVRLPVSSITPYFWGPIPGQTEPRSIKKPLATAGYTKLREIIGKGTVEDWRRVLEEGENVLKVGFRGLAAPGSDQDAAARKVTLSEELQQWRAEQHAAGRVLPSKGHGLTIASDEVLQLLNARDWPKPLLVNSALFGCGLSNMLIGAHDAETMYSNYCTDLCFFYEHGYHRVFPEYEALLDEAANDPRALATPGGKERRQVMQYTLQYVRCKVALEEQYKEILGSKTMRLNWHDAMVLFLCENSIVGQAAEQVVRGYDPAGVLFDFIASCAGTDIIDVGSDLYNSELVNAILGTADIVDTGIVTEAALQNVYDAWAHSCARMSSPERCDDPGVRMYSLLYTWHMMNNRHNFLRRALLGFPKIRTQRVPQREADVCEAFDADFRTTGFSRLLAGACNGDDWCDHTQKRVQASPERKVLEHLWHLYTIAPLEYIQRQVISEEYEEDLAEQQRLAMAKTYSIGLVDDLAWLTGHAMHHAWQVNHLLEAAMWGSLLDDGGLSGKLDRKD